MNNKIQFPSAIHVLRMINSNIVDNLLVRKTAYISETPLYERAYSIVYETGEREIAERLPAPNNEVSQAPHIRILRGTR